MDYKGKLIYNQDMKLTSLQIKRFHQFIHANNPQIIAVYLYGSRVKGYAIKSSDTDIGVVVDSRDELENEREIVFQISNALPFKNSDVRIIDIKSAKIYVRNVIKNGKVLYVRSESDRIRFETKAMKLFYDQSYLRKIYEHFLYKQINEDKYGRGQTDLTEALR